MYLPEIFAGCSRLSAAFAARHCEIGTPVEAYSGKHYNCHGDILEDPVFNSLVFDIMWHGSGSYYHFGLPCSSFSMMNVNLNKGSRSKHHPGGLGLLAREIRGNEILSRTLQLIGVIDKVGGYWSIENPANSYVWLMTDVVSLSHATLVSKIRFDQCGYGLQFPSCSANERVLKPTVVMSNLCLLDGLHRLCSRDHTHAHAIDGEHTHEGYRKRSVLAGRYPVPLCGRWANLALGC